MFWGKKKTPADIFKRSYSAMLEIIKKSSIAGDHQFELLPAMYVVSDFAAASCGKDRIATSNAIIEAIKSIEQNIDLAKFDRRCDLYGEIIRGKELRCEWFMSDPAVFYDNAISKCAALLADILYNPECAENYDNAPIMIYGIFDAMTFSENVVKPLLNELVGLFNGICNLQGQQR